MTSVLPAQLWLLAGNHPKEVWAHTHAQSSRLPDCQQLNRSRRVWNILLMAKHQLPIQDLHLNDVEKEHSGCIHSLAFPFGRGFTRETTKDTKAPPFACPLLHGRILTRSWKAAVPLQGPPSLSRLPAPFQSFSSNINPPSSSKYLTAPSHVIIKATIVMRSYGCRRIFLPRPCFHFLTNICILSQNFPRLLYAWGRILFCFFESLIKCRTARFLEEGDEKKKDVAFFYSKNSCNFIWAFFIVSAAKGSTARMLDRLVAFTEDIMRFWKSYLVTQGILCTRSPVSALAPLMIPFPNSVFREGCSLSQSFWLCLF